VPVVANSQKGESVTAGTQPARDCAGWRAKYLPGGVLEGLIARGFGRVRGWRVWGWRPQEFRLQKKKTGWPAGHGCLHHPRPTCANQEARSEPAVRLSVARCTPVQARQVKGQGSRQATAVRLSVAR